MSTTEVLLPEVEYVREHIRTDAPLETLGQRLRRMAGERNLTQKNLCEMVGRTQGGVNDWMCDRIVPGLATAQRLAKALKVPMGELLDDLAPLSSSSS